MKLISHRGNLNGKNTERENNPTYIDEALKLGFDVEIDIWIVGDKIMLGHDSPQYQIDEDWLHQRADNLWVHCKNIKAVEWCNLYGWMNYFWHESDTLTITSAGFLWVYPGKQPVHNSIAVLPEIHNDDLSVCYGVCSDYIVKYKNTN